MYLLKYWPTAWNHRMAMIACNRRMAYRLAGPLICLSSVATTRTHAHWHITYKVHQVLDLCGHPHLNEWQEQASLASSENQSETHTHRLNTGRPIDHPWSMKCRTFANSANKSIFIYLSFSGSLTQTHIHALNVGFCMRKRENCGRFPFMGQHVLIDLCDFCAYERIV